MGIKHLNLPPIIQGLDNMGCWAASMAWWAQSVRKYNYTMEDIKKLYSEWTNKESGSQKGGLTPKGIKKMLEDYRWNLWYYVTNRGEVDSKFLDPYLDASPVIVGYLDPVANGFHVNVLVAKVPFTEATLFVMDPSFDSFQIRNLQYYREKYAAIVFASSKNV